jgi:cytochrome c oxidase cbb3-type subunit 3
MEGGRSGKGMISWKDQLKPKEMQKVASYVLSLRGSNPKEPKPTEPEAVLYKEEASTDVVKNETVADSLATN